MTRLHALSSTWPSEVYRSPGADGGLDEHGLATTEPLIDQLISILEPNALYLSQGPGESRHDLVGCDALNALAWLVAHAILPILTGPAGTLAAEKVGSGPEDKACCVRSLSSAEVAAIQREVLAALPARPRTENPDVVDIAQIRITTLLMASGWPRRQAQHDAEEIGRSIFDRTSGAARPASRTVRESAYAPAAVRSWQAEVLLYFAYRNRRAFDLPVRALVDRHAPRDLPTVPSELDPSRRPTGLTLYRQRVVSSCLGDLPTLEQLSSLWPAFAEERLTTYPSPTEESLLANALSLVDDVSLSIANCAVDGLLCYRWLVTPMTCLELRRRNFRRALASGRTDIEREGTLSFQKCRAELDRARRESQSLDEWLHRLRLLAPLARYAEFVLLQSPDENQQCQARFMHELFIDSLQTICLAGTSLLRQGLFPARGVTTHWTDRYLPDPRRYLSEPARIRRLLRYGARARVHYPEFWLVLALAYLETQQCKLSERLNEVSASELLSHLGSVVMVNGPPRTITAD